MIGKIISHYKILEKLGEGGMGVVYKVQDTKLDRPLALKFLPPHLTVKESDKARFLQEAKAASAINHPNVCIIHDIQEVEEQQFLVMEYVEGKTLRELVGSLDTPLLKINDIIEYALQIASALEAAHNKGVVHRDIKSENIMVSSANQIKVMDFGLARLKGSLKLTKTSSTVGTLAYMAPEQIEGKATDARSDIFSFGVVLYEMLTGKLPFTGEYESALMYSILNDEPDLVENYRSDLSSEMVHILNRCLEKDPEDRYQTIHDVVIDLKRVKRDSSKVSRMSLKDIPVSNVSGEAEEVTTKIKPKRKSIYFKSAVIIAGLALLIISFFLFNPFTVEPLPPMIATPFTSLPGYELGPTFSPDGTQIAFFWASETRGNQDIYVKVIGAGSEQLLVGDSGDDVIPAWSPDGRYIAFCRFWHDQDESGIYIIPARGGTEIKLASVNLGQEWWRTNLSWSADSKSLAFSAMDSSKDFSRIYLLSVDSRHIQELTDGPDMNLNDTYCTISPDGKELAFVRGAGGSYDLYTVPMSGGEVLQLTSDSTGIAGLTWSNDGSEIIFSHGSTLWRISASGGDPRQMPVSGDDLENPVIAKQGNLLAYEKWDYDQDIWRMEIPTLNRLKSEPSKFIYSTQIEGQAKYSPDGKNIAYISNKSGSNQLWICDSNAENHQQITSMGAWDPYWSPDGRMLTYVGNFEDQKEIFTVNVEGGSPVQITKNPADAYYPSFSGDGRWIYFTSNRNGEWQVWKISSQGGEALQVTRNGGYIAHESADGKSIYYCKYDTMGIWKKSLPEGDETLVLKGKQVDEIQWETQWDLSDEGIFYRTYGKKRGGYLIEFYNFANESITEMVNLGKGWQFDINVSTDQRWILYTQEARHEVDIILVKNFR